jgi:methylated-DNA-[protein]-cysteine S-methyltransferase
MVRFHIFETAIGWAAIVWGPSGLAGACLPEPDASGARRLARKRFPAAEEAADAGGFESIVEGVQALLRGEPADFSEAPLDLERVPAFDARVYAITRTITAGETLTYGAIARRIGDRFLAREVGAALGRNPWPIIVPCHRVTAAGGAIGGFSARGGAQTKLKLLRIEGAPAAGQADLFGL